MGSNEIEEILYDDEALRAIELHGNVAREQQDEIRRRAAQPEPVAEVEETEENLLLPDELEELWACEDAIRRGMQAWLAVCEALHTIRTKRLYREDYPNFGAYCREKWDLTDRHARNLANAWDVALTIDPDPLGNPEQLPQNERQARELKRVPKDRRAEIWEAAVEAAGGIEHVCAHDVATARTAAMEAEGVEERWDGQECVWAGIASQSFEPDESGQETAATQEVVVVDRDPANHAARLVNKHGAAYCMELMLAMGEILREKGQL